MNPVDEAWQGYSENGQPTGPVSLPECKLGALHGSTHVWFWRQGSSGIELLFQRRSPSVRTWAGYLDISAAGHMDAGETPIVTALRETKEETGLVLTPDDLQLLSVYRLWPMTTDTGIIENEFQWLYGYELADTSVLNLTSNEVDEFKWLTIPQIQHLLSQPAIDKILPHSDAYFAMLFSALKVAAKQPAGAIPRA